MQKKLFIGISDMKRFVCHRVSANRCEQLPKDLGS